MSEYLVLSAVGRDQPGIVKALSESIVAAGANIDASRMTVLGGEFAIILMVSGTGEAVGELEKKISDIERQTALTIQMKRTEPRQTGQNMLPYSVKVVSMDQPGIVHSVTGFFSAQGINIEELSTATYAAAHTGTPMFSLDMTVNIPGDIRMSRLRQTFTEFCDALFIDAVLEPVNSGR